MRLQPEPLEAFFSGRQSVRAWRFAPDGSRSGPVGLQVVHEDVLSIDVEAVGSYALMWSPTEQCGTAVGYTRADGILADAGTPEVLALTAGFLFTEGIIGSRHDIAEMSVCPERPDVVRVRLVAPDLADVRRRNVVMNSSCGVCGGRDQVVTGMACAAPVSDRLRLGMGDFASILEALRQRQEIFHSTGGTHAALAFSSKLEILTFAEDLGRHNAMDKIIGYCLLQDQPFSGMGTFVSSRLSYEMVAKAARAGFELIAAISAPSSLAIEMADRLGITLCGFVRGHGGEVYTHGHRITDIAST